MIDEEAEKYFEDKCGTYFETTKAEIKEDVCNAFKDGYNKANEWHFVRDALPPNPKESEDVNRIAELEKENAELKKQCDTLDKSLVVSTKNNIERQKIIDEYKERIAEFEAKLLQERETYWGKGFNYSKDQITQAKEIIKELLESCFGYASKSVNYEIKARAEKFLKESEE